MNKDRFRALFLKAVEEAIAAARPIASGELPADFEIELHGTGVGGAIMGFDRAADRLFIDDDLCNPIIDVGVKAVRADRCVIFVRASDRTPEPPEKILGSRDGSFNVVLPVKVAVLD